MRRVLYKAAQQSRQPVRERLHRPDRNHNWIRSKMFSGRSITKFYYNACITSAENTCGRAHRRPHIIRSWNAKSGWTRQKILCMFWRQGSLLCSTACQWTLTSTRPVMCTFYLTEQVGWRSGKCCRPAFGGSPAPIFTRTMVMLRYFSVFSFSLYRPRYDID